MINFFFETFQNIISTYYKGGVICGILFCCISSLAEKTRITCGKKSKTVLFSFAVYLYFLFVLTVISRTDTHISEINLYPFAAFHQSEWERAYFYTNILLFFPMPVFLYLLYPKFRSFWKHALLGFFISAGIELTQYTLHCGWCDIDDVISNNLGMALGWLCVHGFSLRKKCFPSD